MTENVNLIKPAVLEAYASLKNIAIQTEKIRMTEVFDCGDSTYGVALTDVGAEDFECLRDTLSAGNKSLLWDNTIADNRFCGYSDGNGYTCISYIPCRKEIRILYAYGGISVPERLGDRIHYDGEKSVTQVCPDDTAGNFGMCYVFALGEGHFIVYDGNGDLGDDHDKLYGFLSRGAAPSEKPVVDAWIVTHPHWDHVSGFAKFAKKYGDLVGVRNILVNFPSLSVPYQYKDLGNLAFSRDCWLKTVTAYYADAKVYKVHTGQRIAIGDATVEVLYTHENIYPCKKLAANDSSTVTMLTLCGKKFFMPADISCVQACELLRDMYGEYLKSDFYQAAHHGWDTEALSFYGYVDASVVLWPLRKRDWEKIQKYPATQVMTREWEENRRKFYISFDQSDTVVL